MIRVESYLQPFTSAVPLPISYSAGSAHDLSQRLGKWPSGVYVGNYSGNKVLGIEFGDGTTADFNNPRKGQILRLGDMRSLTTNNDITDLVFLYQK